VVAALILFVAGAGNAAGRPLQLEEALQLERDGDAAAAARLYISWTRERAGQPSSLAGYAGFLRTEHGLDALVDACRELAGNLPKMPGAWPLLAETARLFELAGLDEEAADFAVDAWRRGGPVSLLQRAMRLTLAMGDLDAYAALAERTVTVPDLDALASTRELLAGRLEEARTVSARILSTVEDPSARLSAAWNLFEAARAGGNPADLAQAAARLAQLFPGSPETAIALAAASGTGSRVSEAPSPTLFLSAGQAPTKGPGSEVPAVTPAAKTFSVQAGSFQMRENADELVKDLSRAGFTAVVREGSVQGRAIFRVFAATGLDRESAARLLERLRSAGYAGITVAD
jgi:cell division septation protein DedD